MIPQSTKENFTRTTEKCEDIGQVCESGTICNGTATFTDNYTKYCCPGTCISSNQDDPESTSYGWTIGIVILIILSFTGYYFYEKQKGLKPKTPKDTLDATSEKFEKRMSGVGDQRTTGNLSKS